jgi:hypothetical protein
LTRSIGLTSWSACPMIPAEFCGKSPASVFYIP